MIEMKVAGIAIDATNRSNRTLTVGPTALPIYKSRSGKSNYWCLKYKPPDLTDLL